MIRRALRNFAFLPLVALFLLSACSERKAQEGENDTRLSHESEIKKEASSSDRPGRPNLAALVETALVSDSALTKRSPDRDVLLIEYDSLFVLLGGLAIIQEEFSEYVRRANEQPRGEFETIKIWEERKHQAVVQVENDFLSRMSRLCGTSVIDGKNLLTRAPVSKSVFVYDPDMERMELETQSIRVKESYPQFISIHQLMYSKVQYGHRWYDGSKWRRWDEEPHLIWTKWRPGDSGIAELYFSLRGPSFSPDMAPLFKEALENGDVIADIEFMFKYSTEIKKIDTEVISVTYRNVEGDILIYWDSVIKYINYSSGPRAYREIVVMHKPGSLR